MAFFKEKPMKYYTSTDLRAVTKISATQVKYWKDTNFFVPEIASQGTGRTNYYNFHQVLEVVIIKYLIDMKVELQMTKKITKALIKLEPNFYDLECKSNYLVLFQENQFQIVKEDTSDKLIFDKAIRVSFEKLYKSIKEIV